MRCDDYQCMISALADGELNDRDRLDLEHHLAECAGCRRAYEETCDIQSRLADVFLDCPDVPHLEAAVMSRVLPRRRLSLRWAWAGSAAGFAAACVLAVLLLFQPHEHKPSPVHVASGGEHRVPAVTPGSKSREHTVHPAPAPRKPVYGVATVKVMHRPRRKHTVHPDNDMPSAQPAPVSVEQAVVAVEYVDDVAPEPTAQRTAEFNDGLLRELSPMYRIDGTPVMVRDIVAENSGETAIPRYEIQMDKGIGGSPM